MIKNIPHPDLTSARQLSPLEMNAIHFDKKHTVLTPDVLEKMQSEAAAATKADASAAQSAVKPQ